MFHEMLRDFIGGIIDSLRFSKVFRIIYINVSLRKLFIKICKYNVIMHCLPCIFCFILQVGINFDLFAILYYLNYIINMISILFHLLHYMDLINILSTISLKIYKNISTFHLIVFSITMMIYQINIYLITTVIQFIFHENLYFLSLCLNFFILTFYHSFYCYNNLWQYKRLDLNHRIDIHEKLWPYYLGYGTIPSIIYMYTNISYNSYNTLIICFYNIHLFFMISIPFLIESRYPTKILPYPSINLSIFAYITKWTVNIIKYLLNA